MSNNFKPYFYDKELNKVTCYSYQDFIKTLASLQTKGSPILVNDTLFLSSFHFIFADGTRKQYFKWYELYERIEEDLGIPIKKRDFSNFCGATTYVMMLDDSVSIDTNTDKLVGVESVIEEPIVEDVVSDNAVDESIQEDVEDLIEAEEVSDTVEIDYDMLNSFFNEDDLKGSKSALEAYVQTTYGIDLNKRLSFSNMIAQLEEELK